MGSVAYGASTDISDFDVVGFCIPSKELLFPHLAGQIEGFGRQKQKFEVYQQHHVMDPDALAGKGRQYDLNIYSIAKYFQLCMECNPNMIDSMFVPQDCILHITKVGNMVRDRRRDFLHKGAWHKFKGYAYSQLHKMKGKGVEEGSNRDKLRQQYGFDVKFAYHTVRLLYEAEQILQEGDIDLRRHSEHLKSIRRGDVSEDDILAWASNKEKHLEAVYEQSKLRYGPDEPLIKQLLLDCLEDHYGNLSACVVVPDDAVVRLKQIDGILRDFFKDRG
jgi:predicted nucleotidyltransferase